MLKEKLFSTNSSANEPFNSVAVSLTSTPGSMIEISGARNFRNKIINDRTHDRTKCDSQWGLYISL